MEKRRLQGINGRISRKVWKGVFLIPYELKLNQDKVPACHWKNQLFFKQIFNDQEKKWTILLLVNANRWRRLVKRCKKYCV